MGEHIKIEGHENLRKDTDTHAIINTNRNAYEMAKRRAVEAQKQRDEIRDTNRELNNLKCEMHEIKSLLKQLVKEN
tara:strand:- start:363 stop:590 length:228 start_codon:yes stop_codon:yes gene_type:complete